MSETSKHEEVLRWLLEELLPDGATRACEAWCFDDYNMVAVPLEDLDRWARRIKAALSPSERELENLKSCPVCGKLNFDDWPLTIDGEIKIGGCQDCWEKENDRKWWKMVCFLS